MQDFSLDLKDIKNKPSKTIGTVKDNKKEEAIPPTKFDTEHQTINQNTQKKIKNSADLNFVHGLYKASNYKISIYSFLPYIKNYYFHFITLIFLKTPFTPFL